jgi:hypothetical protein
LHICRDGREIECIQPPSDWTRFQVYDRNIKIEIDFDPELDEFFGITTAKQQITISEEMWDRLRNRGKLMDLITDLRKRLKRDKKSLDAQMENTLVEEEEREKFKPTKREPTERKRQKARERLEREADKISEQERRERETVIAELEEAGADRPFRVNFVSVMEGPFYRPERIGEQKRLYINTAHPFYDKVYNVVPEARAALEVVLFVLADAELDAENDFETFYQMARTTWSERLRHALEQLSSDESIFDAASAAAAMTEIELQVAEEEG